jgi:hypothetical protein
MPDSCPLVGCQSKSAKIRRIPDNIHVTCPVCGDFVIVATLAATADFRQDPDLIEGLRAYIRAENEADRVPSLNSSWKRLAEAYQPSAFSKLFGK